MNPASTFRLIRRHATTISAAALVAGIVKTNESNLGLTVIRGILLTDAKRFSRNCAAKKPPAKPGGLPDFVPRHAVI
jgi:hypothetical protein